MALGDAISFELRFNGKKIVTEEVVDFTGSGTVSSTAIIIAAVFEPMSGGSPHEKVFQVNFNQYQSGLGVNIKDLKIPGIPTNHRLNSYLIRQVGTNTVRATVTLEPTEKKEFPDGGILFVDTFAIDAIGVLA